MSLLGAVLAGGLSTRFGSDKALAELHGRPLIEHAIAALSAQVSTVIVCGREWEDWVPDRPEPGLGPLGGINAALHTAAERGYESVLTIPCDVPALPPDLLSRLRAPAFLEAMPVIGHWPAALAGELDAFLSVSEDRSMRAWARSVGAIPVRIAETLANINRPEDLAKLSRAPC